MAFPTPLKILSALVCMLLTITLNGCFQPQWVRKPYPFWGEEVYLYTAGENSALHMQFLSPLNKQLPQACLLIVHGMNEHIGRYGEIARHFANRFIVAGVDLSGSGLSNSVLLQAHRSIQSGSKQVDVSHAYEAQAKMKNLNLMRKDLGQSLDYLVNHCDQVSGQANLPVFILSHSLGSLVTASYLLQAADHPLNSRISGLIFSGPAFAVTHVPGWRGWIQNPLIDFTFYTQQHFLEPQDEILPVLIFNQLISLLTVPLQDGIIELLSLPGARKVFSPSTPDWVVEYLSDWQEERIRHRADNYILRRTVLRFVLGVEKEIIQFRKQMQQFSIPYLLIYSEFDPITPAWGNRDFAATTLNRHSDNELMLLNGENHHEQLFSSPPLRSRILKRIDNWINQRLQKKSQQ